MSDLALLDTNVLVYALFEDAEHHAASRSVLERAAGEDAGLCLLPQNVVEFYAAVTNPRRVSNPKTSGEALEALGTILSLPGLQVLPVPIDVVSRVLALIARRPVLGARVHDLHLLAAMLGNGVTRLYTFNVDDFAAFGEVTTIVPGAS